MADEKEQKLQRLVKTLLDDTVKYPSLSFAKPISTFNYDKAPKIEVRDAINKSSEDAKRVTENSSPADLGLADLKEAPLGGDLDAINGKRLSSYNKVKSTFGGVTAGYTELNNSIENTYTSWLRGAEPNLTELKNRIKCNVELLENKLNDLKAISSESTKVADLVKEHKAALADLSSKLDKDVDHLTKELQRQVERNDHKIYADKMANMNESERIIWVPHGGNAALDEEKRRRDKDNEEVAGVFNRGGLSKKLLADMDLMRENLDKYEYFKPLGKKDEDLDFVIHRYQKGEPPAGRWYIKAEMTGDKKESSLSSIDVFKKMIEFQNQTGKSTDILEYTYDTPTTKFNRNIRVKHVDALLKAAKEANPPREIELDAKTQLALFDCPAGKKLKLKDRYEELRKAAQEAYAKRVIGGDFEKEKKNVADVLGGNNSAISKLDNELKEAKSKIELFDAGELSAVDGVPQQILNALNINEEYKQALNEFNAAEVAVNEANVKLCEAEQRMAKVDPEDIGEAADAVELQDLMNHGAAEEDREAARQAARQAARLALKQQQDAYAEANLKFEAKFKAKQAALTNLFSDELKKLNDHFTAVESAVATVQAQRDKLVTLYKDDYENPGFSEQWNKLKELEDKVKEQVVRIKDESVVQDEKGVPADKPGPLEARIISWAHAPDLDPADGLNNEKYNELRDKAKEMARSFEALSVWVKEIDVDAYKANHDKELEEKAGAPSVKKP